MVKPWYTLLTAAKNSLLLPKLTSLRLYDSYWMCDHQILWVYAFASPSLRSMTTDNALVLPYSDISCYAMSIILAHLRRTSPALESLTIFPGLDYKEGEPDGQSVYLSLLQEEPFHTHLSNFSHLSSFATTTNTLTAGGILALATLPRLASLDLSPMHHHPARSSLKKTDLPPKSFQALRHLGVHFLPVLDIYTIWTMSSLVARLTSLELEFWIPEDLQLDISLEVDKFLRIMIPVISRGSRLISDLTLDWGGPNNRYSSGKHIDFITVHLATLPLRRLSIRRFINDEVNNLLLHEIETPWSHIRDLAIPEYHADLDELSHLAVLPRLERLVISLNREHKWESLHLKPARHARSKNFHALVLVPESFSLPQGKILKGLAR